MQPYANLEKRVIRKSLQHKFDKKIKKIKEEEERKEKEKKGEA